jgi:hypothetical protein
MKCADCKFSQKQPNMDLSNTLLECWYNPPQTLILPNGQMALQYQAVRPKDRCSKFVANVALED